MAGKATLAQLHSLVASLFCARLLVEHPQLQKWLESSKRAHEGLPGKGVPQSSYAALTSDARVVSM